MAKYIYNLFLDESGSFGSDNKGLGYNEYSLVGGLLCNQNYMTDERANKLLPSRVHCCEYYNKDYLKVLETLHKDGCHFVVFENREQLRSINSDITYLNVLSEGLVQLLRNIRLENPNDDIALRVTIALRKQMSASSGVIKQQEYLSRLKEKIDVEVYKQNLEIGEYRLSFSDARSYKMLDFADIICNTWHTRTRVMKFTEDERKLIQSVYDPKYIYSVFESATIGYLKRLLSEGRYGEAMHEISRLQKITGVTDIRNKIINQIAKGLPAEQKSYFTFMSLQISQYNARRLYHEGIILAENYKKYFLNPMTENPKLSFQIPYWLFDTDFYLLTMYDHIGNVSRCGQYLEECRRNIGSINHSWEHIDYYFKFRIREMNCLIGRFDFEAVAEKADNMISILQSAKELFSMIETYDNTTEELKSELLGKVYGVELEAYINILCQNKDPNNAKDLFNKAKEASDNAIAEFSGPADLHRQYQYRCNLMLAAKQEQEALEYLLKVYDLKPGHKSAFEFFVDRAYGDKNNKDLFAVWHYTNVMLAMMKNDGRTANQMYSALNNSKAFTTDLLNKNKTGYPWNMIVWNMSRWYRQTASSATADKYFDRAVAITREYPEQVTMYSFSIPMIADLLLQRLNKGETTVVQAEKEMRKVCNEFGKLDIPDTMRAVFVPAAEEKIDTNVLRRLSNVWLR